MKLKSYFAFIVVLIVITLGFTISIFDSNYLNESEKISNTISLWTSFFTSGSVLILLFNYLLERNGYSKSLEPALLIQVMNENHPENLLENQTLILYSNQTKNYFSDLSIYCSLSFNGIVIDYSSLFKEKFYMGPNDARQRRFAFTKDLKERGYDIVEISNAGNKVVMRLGFSYTHDGVPYRYDVQEYKFNGVNYHWEII